jgi:hypothetical protein
MRAVWPDRPPDKPLISASLYPSQTVRGSAGIDPGDQFQSKKARQGFGGGAVAIKARRNALEGVALTDGVDPRTASSSGGPPKCVPVHRN